MRRRLKNIMLHEEATESLQIDMSMDTSNPPVDHLRGSDLRSDASMSSHAGSPQIAGELPMWHGNHRRQMRQVKRKAKRNKAKEQDLGDISDLLRREFVQCTVAGIKASVRRTEAAQVAAAHSPRRALPRPARSPRSHAAHARRPRARQVEEAAQVARDARVNLGAEVEMQERSARGFGGGGGRGVGAPSTKSRKIIDSVASLVRMALRTLTHP